MYCFSVRKLSQKFHPGLSDEFEAFVSCFVWWGKRECFILLPLKVLFAYLGVIILSSFSLLISRLNSLSSFRDYTDFIISGCHFWNLNKLNRCIMILGWPNSLQNVNMLYTLVFVDSCGGSFCWLILIKIARNKLCELMWLTLACGLSYQMSESQLLLLLTAGQLFECYNSLAQKVLMTNIHVIFEKRTILDLPFVCSSFSGITTILKTLEGKILSMAYKSLLRTGMERWCGPSKP